MATGVPTADGTRAARGGGGIKEFEKKNKEKKIVKVNMLENIFLSIKPL